MSAAWNAYWADMARVGYWISMGLTGLLMIGIVRAFWTTRHIKEDK